MTQRLAVDIGGTFVDAIVFDTETGVLRLEKDFTTPDNAAEGVLAAIARFDLSLSPPAPITVMISRPSVFTS